jgi:hypothetical protein
MDFRIADTFTDSLARPAGITPRSLNARYPEFD